MINMTILLAFLTPDLVKAAVDGRLPPWPGRCSPTRLPAEWSKQHQILGPHRYDPGQTPQGNRNHAAGRLAVRMVTSCCSVEVMVEESSDDCRRARPASGRTVTRYRTVAR